MPKVSLPQITASGFSGSPTLAMKRRSGKLAHADRIGTRLHQHPDRGGCRVPDIDPLGAKDVVPACHIKFRLVHDHRHAVRQRRDDPVGRARDPARIGGAPIDITGPQIERDPAGRVMGDNGLMHMHHAFGLARCSGCEMQQGRVFGQGLGGCETVRGAAISGARSVGALDRAVDGEYLS